MTRFDQCSIGCTTDCGHCKGDPVGALRIRLAEVEAERDALRRQRAEVWQRIDLWSDDPDTNLDQLLDVWASHEKALAVRETAVALLRGMVDNGRCVYDHHGYCQTHRLFERPCANARALALIATLDGA